ncbi:MAG: DUF975 family protein [Lachnospiraceae bacterium]|nr:DUF975 family protein [Lachnospiraceae bacterium]
MWTRAELKEQAKAGLRKYYWYGLLVVFVAGLLGAGSNGAVSGGPSVTVRNTLDENSVVHQQFMDPMLSAGLIIMMLSIMLAVFAVVLCFTVFVSNVVAVGKCRYFTMSTLNMENAGFEELFSGFKKGRYLNLVKIQFCRGLFEGLWTLLLIIPGIIKHYEYYMVPYLAAEYPDMDRKEIFQLSRQMMDGNKFNTWVLELSFIGWELLGLLACCVGMIFVEPYYEATFAELYLKLREERLGISRFGGTHAPDADGAVYTQELEN